MLWLAKNNKQNLLNSPVKEKFLSETGSPSSTVLDYGSKFHERLHAARYTQRASCIPGEGEKDIWQILSLTTFFDYIFFF